jgi:serine/threonine-protein kinase
MSLGNPSVDPDPNVVAGNDDASDVEVARVLESYLVAVEAGRPADPQRLLEEYPDLADRLRACLRVLKVAELAVRDATAATGIPKGRPAALLPHDPGPGFGSLSTLDFGPGEPPRVLLRDLADDAEPIHRLGATAISHNGARAGRFQVQGEIARGGMGAVLKGRDVDLGRDLAIKVLLESHQGKADVVRRFVEEAQIGGQLQHPGVVPVYELGALPDHRPFFAMKLVKGRTLAALLHERADTVADLPRFLGIFEAVCQTVAYAHARGVIHRDLKPSNVMVGSFGEIQVMDWGLAKVLPSGGIADEGGSRPAQETVIVTVRSGSAGSGSESQAGSVLGTPAYMAPEQARGEVEQIDERADVFGLGAILCEILTGRTPFGGSSREEVLAQAARCDLSDALGRLENCGADAELIEIAGSCLRPELDRRPRTAGEVARRITGYLDGVQHRLKAAELARVEAETKGAEERKRRRLAVALAASVLGLILLGGGGWTYLLRQRTARLISTTRMVSDALAEAERFRGQAQSAPAGDMTKWSEAMAATKRARDLLVQGESDDALRNRVKVALADLEREQAAAQQRATELDRDHKFLSQLETIRGSRSEHLDRKRTSAEYAAAFRAFGIELDQLDPKEAGRRIAQRSEPVELASYVDDWALQRVKARDKKDEPSWRRLFEAASEADPDPWRLSVRRLIGGNDQQALGRLATDDRSLEAQPALSLLLLGEALSQRGDQVQAEKVLRRAWRKAPGDFWVNAALGKVHLREDPFAKPEEAARFYSAAVAIHPGSGPAHNDLGIALAEQGKLEDAIAEFREALRANPNDAVAHNNLGKTLPDYAQHVAEIREAIRLKPDFAEAHHCLGIALVKRGKLGEGIAEFREAVRLNGDDPKYHVDLGTSLSHQGRLDEAIAQVREALRLKGDLPQAHNSLGTILDRQGQAPEAIAEYREALRLRPDYLEAHANLGLTLRDQGRLTEAVTEFRKARDLARTNPGLVQRIDRDLAATEREATLTPRLPAIASGKLKPDNVAEALGFAQLCYDKKLHGASARLWAEAFKGQPKLADDMQAQNRYNAACAAALAGTGQGKDEPSLD